MNNGFSLRPNAFTDVGNADVFVREYRDELIFTDSMGWLYWDGKRWKQDEHKALELAESFSVAMLKEARELYREAGHKLADLKADAEAGGQVSDDVMDSAKNQVKQADAYLKHAKFTQRAGRVKAILDLARPFMVLPGTAMDANPFDLNTQAGIVDLVTGEWRPNQREARCMKITAVSRNSEGAELWKRFLETITCGESETEDFLQLVIGMSLFGKVYQERVTFAVGGGRNGKSTFFNAVAAVLGDYAGYIDIDVITMKNGNDKTALSTLRGKRLVIAGELEENRYLSAASIKRISSTDPFQVEEKYKQPETIIPSHTLCMFTNHLPHVSSTDEGTWRRINSEKEFCAAMKQAEFRDVPSKGRKYYIDLELIPSREPGTYCGADDLPL